MAPPTTSHRLVILFGVGGLSDVGRHAVQVALDEQRVAGHEITHVTAIAMAPHHLQLNEANWKCSCEQPHSIMKTTATTATSDAAASASAATNEKGGQPHSVQIVHERFTVVAVSSWKEGTEGLDEILAEHCRDATAIITCLGNRESFRGHRDCYDGNTAAVRAMRSTQGRLKRIVAITSVGIEEDWPPLEFFKPAYYILSCLFMSLASSAFKDLTNMERALKATEANEIDYLLVRPVGLGEEVVPANTWKIQTKKYEDDDIYMNMAKLDCARYVVEEALNPTRHREAVVIGAVPQSTNESS